MTRQRDEEPTVTLLEIAPQQSTSTAVLGHRVISVTRDDSTASGRTHRAEQFGALAADEDERAWPASPWFEPPWKP